MATYQELMQAFKDQGISPDWTYQPYIPPYNSSDGNDPYANSIEKIAPEVTLGGTVYSYNPDTQTFSSGGEETKDPNTGWGRTIYQTTPEGTTQQRERSKTDFEKLKPLLIAASVMGGAGLAGMGGLGGLLGGEAAAGGIAPELIGGGLGSGLEVAAAVPEFAGGVAGAAGGVPAYFSTGLGDTALANFGGTSLAGPSSGLASLNSGSSLFAPTLADAVASFGAAPLTLSGAANALYNAATSGAGMTSAGAGGSSGLSSLGSAASKLFGGGGDGGGGGINPLLGGGLGALAGYLASRDQPKGSVDTKAIQMAIPQYEFSRNQQTPPTDFKPGVSPEFRHFDNKMVKKAAGGGITGLRSNEYKAGGRYLQGPGDGMSDNIRANIEGHQEARLATSEFVLPADVVSHIGNGSSEAGAKKLHAMMARIRKARTGNPKQGKQIKAEKYLPA
jgi:hypothetical protein